MKWRKYTIYTTTEAEDIVSLMLNENGVEGVQIENNVPLSDADTKGMFIDILPELGADDGSSKVSFFLRLEEDAAGTSGTTENAPGGSADDDVSGGAADNSREKNVVDSVDAENVNAAVFSDRTKNAESDKPANNAAEDRSYSIDDKVWSEAEADALLDTIKRELEEMRSYTDVGEGRIEIGVTEDTDWRDNWKKFFKPIVVGDFLIKPTWEEIPEELKGRADDGSLRVIEIDPGTAFGTGSHETTQLCIDELDSCIRDGDKVLDIGTGSGILGIAALKCGAASVMATELDEMCESSIRDNASYNGISEEEFKLIIGNVIGDEEVISSVKAEAPSGYDVVIANILAPVIVMLAAPGAVDALIRKGGTFITSGIINTRADEVKAAFEANPAWKLKSIRTRGEWVGITAERV